MKANRFRFRVWIKATNKMVTAAYDFIMPRLLADGRLRIQYDSTDVTDEVVLMQSTGLLDKNGEEIFEGDIIQTVLDNGFGLSMFILRWNELTASFHKERDDGMFFPVGRVSESSKEIIGNIYENPELVNKTKGTQNASHIRQH